jgi:hypothetical protein
MRERGVPPTGCLNDSTRRESLLFANIKRLQQGATPSFEWRPPRLSFLLRLGIEQEVVSSVARMELAQACLLCGFLGCDRRPFNPQLAILLNAPA